MGGGKGRVAAGVVQTTGVIRLAFLCSYCDCEPLCNSTAFTFQPRSEGQTEVQLLTGGKALQKPQLEAVRSLRQVYVSHPAKAWVRMIILSNWDVERLGSNGNWNVSKHWLFRICSKTRKDDVISSFTFSLSEPQFLAHSRCSVNTFCGQICMFLLKIGN
jgi:hypothetical protein